MWVCKRWQHFCFWLNYPILEWFLKDQDIKLSLVKILTNDLLFAIYTKTNYNLKSMLLIYGVVQCVADRVWWAKLWQKVQGHFLAPVRPCWSQTTYVRDSEEVKLQHAGYRPLNVIPVGTIVSQPVSRVLAHSGEGGAGEDHGTARPKRCFWGSGIRNKILDALGVLAPH